LSAAVLSAACGLILDVGDHHAIVISDGTDSSSADGPEDRADQNAIDDHAGEANVDQPDASAIWPEDEDEDEDDNAAPDAPVLDGVADVSAEDAAPLLRCGARPNDPACPGSAGPPMQRMSGGFCIDSTEVTQSQYDAFLAAAKNGLTTPVQPDECSSWNLVQYDVPCIGLYGCSTCDKATGEGCTSCRPDDPATCVNWCNAYAFCRWAGKRLCGRIGGGGNYDSAAANDPYQSEWLNACTFGGAQAYPYGGKGMAKVCNDSSLHSTDTLPVASRCGCMVESVFDLVGNASEWDGQCDGASGATDTCYARGDSFYDPPQGDTPTTCANRGSTIRAGSGLTLGFRCCADPITTE
jgi:formylglycine-generating enzyme required for sulfatase activity